MNKYKPTIGLEIHAELSTKTKMFCACKNDPDEKEPNTNICPVCMAHPGTLPVPNKEAVERVIKVGKALGAQINKLSEFDRKNYFYPDIPKGYQISQYKFPIVFGGELKGVKITRVHLEEDTAKSLHLGDGSSLVDFNRAGVPLMELVTEPVITSKEEAVGFAKELQLLLQYLGVSEANMEKGQMRVEVNISLSKDETFGTKVEVKNINSFKAVEKAIDFEIKRQTELLEKDELIKQETRGFDENKQSTFAQRSKESSKDYRYFPDPDLPKMDLGVFDNVSILETPDQKRIRFAERFALKEADIDFFINNRHLADFFEETTTNLKAIKDFQVVSNFIVSDVAGAKTDRDKLTAKSFAELIEMYLAKEISSRGVKDILAELLDKGGDVREIAEEKGLFQKSNKDELINIVDMILKSNPEALAEYRSGKESIIKFFVGKVMKETKGSANPEMLDSIIKERLAK